MAIQLGPYTLIRPVRRGGMGEVWLARRRGEGTVAAVKVLNTDLRGKTMLRGLRTEIRAVAALDHPNIVRLHDHGHVRRSEAADSQLFLGTPWLAMEYVGGGTLGQSLNPTWPQARAWLLGLLAALAHAHARGVIHRDLKPENVLFDPQGRIKLTDFGLAYLQERHLEGTEQAPLGGGTAAWMAPEQHARRWIDQGPWTDLYTVGTLGWRLLTGKRAFLGQGETVRRAHLHSEPPAFIPRMPLPDAVEPWLRKLLNKRPQDRYVFAASARQALEAMPAGPARPRRCRMAPVSLPTEPASQPSSVVDIREPLGLERLRLPRFVGREGARDQAIEDLEQLAGGLPSVLVLRGPSGIGKSHLARWIYEQAQERGLAQALHASAAAGGLHTLIKRHLRWTREARLERRLSEVLGQQDMRDPREHQDLREFLAHPKRLPRERRHALTMRYLTRVAERRPLLAWIDDAHLGSDSLRFALRVARTAQPLPLMLLLTVQDEGLREPHLMDLLEREGQARVLSMRPLRPSALHALLTESLKLAPRAAELVAETTSGNPLFAVHLVDSWRDQGALRRSSEGLDLRAGVTLRLPDGLHEVWRERTQQLLRSNPSWRAPLRVAALLGLAVSESEWQEACQTLGIDAPEGLVDTLLRARLARPETGGWTFAHSLLRASIIRDAEEDGAAPSLHRACARALPHSPLRRGRHLAAAGDAEQALAPMLQAAEASILASEWSQAVRLLQEREECLDRIGAGPRAPLRVDGWLHLSAAKRLLGDLDTAAHLARRTLAAAQSHGRIELEALAHLSQAAISRTLGHISQAVSEATKAATCARSLATPSLHARALFELGMIRLQAGEHRRAAANLEDALSLDGRASWAAQAWLTLAQVGLELDMPTLCSRALQEARLLAEVTKQPYVLAHVELTQGDLVRHITSALDRSVAHYRSALDTFTRLGSRSAGGAQARIGLVALQRGELREARLDLERALDHCAGSEPCSLAHMALLVLSAGDLDKTAFDLHLAHLQQRLPPKRELVILGPIAHAAARDWPERQQAIEALLGPTLWSRQSVGSRSER